MTTCPNPACKHRVGGKITVCPACGVDLPRPIRIGDYTLADCVADTRTASIYRASKGEAADIVCLRLYDADVALTPEQAALLQQMFEALRELPAERFIHTLDFGCDSQTGLWYRVTPWLPNVKAWGDLNSQSLQGSDDRKREWLDLCVDLAESFRILHESGRVIPDFTLDDCLLYRTAEGALRVRLDATLASCLGPGSIREKVRDRHPDFTPGHTLSEQSDVWTLGSILVAMLAGTADIADPAKAMEELNAQRSPVAVHPSLGRLLRQMTDSDPTRRPRNMKSVCKALRAFGPAEIAEWNTLECDPLTHGRLTRNIALIAAVAVVVAASLTAVLYQRLGHRIDVVPEQRALALLARYRHSVAFVLTELWFNLDGKQQTLSSASGTAFLVTEDGYLLSNRHVVAPWLSGETAHEVERVITQLRRAGKPFRFGVTYRLWFDGDEAFRPSITAKTTRNPGIADAYRVDTAYSSANSTRCVRVAGVMPRPADPAEFLASTLEDDLAVLKVDVPPANAVPIPLRKGPPPLSGSALLALGYSHGRDPIPGTRAEARSSRGIVSGTSGDVITIDADMQPGNSGGPVLDLNGHAVGIASALFAVNGSAQTSMGRVLPIETASTFLEAVRAGKPAWNGLTKDAFEPEICAANKAVKDNDWESARMLVKVEGVSSVPEVALLAAVFSMDKTGFIQEGRLALEGVCAMAPHFPLPALLLYWDAWRRDLPPAERPYRKALLESEWHSPFEFYGEVVRLLEGDVLLAKAEACAESPVEVALLQWAAATAAARNGQREEAIKRFSDGLRATQADDTLLRNLLVSSLWFECSQRPDELAQKMPQEAAVSVDENDAAAFVKALRDALRKESGAALNTAVEQSTRFQPLEHAFSALHDGNWARASEAVDHYFHSPHRESANTLGMGLLRAQLHGLNGDAAAERQALSVFCKETKNLWYKRIAACLLGQDDPEALFASVKDKRHETLTLAIALGLQAESRNDITRASGFYRTARDTGQTNWKEFQLAVARCEALEN